MPSNYSGPITTIAPSLFTEAVDPTGKFFTTSDMNRISWANLVNALQDAGFFDEIFINAGSGITVTGTGTEGDPFVVAATGGGTGGASIVSFDNLAELQGVGAENTVYFVYDIDGQGTNGIYSWNVDASAYQLMTPGGAGSGVSASRSDVSATGLTGKVKAAGAAPVLSRSVAGEYALNIAADVDFRGLRLTAANGATATDGSLNLQLDLISADSQFEYAVATVIDDNTGNQVQVGGAGLNISYNNDVAGRIRITFQNIGGLTAFTIILAPCA